MGVFQDIGAVMLKARSPSLSIDRGKNRSRFDADLRTVDPVDTVEMYDGVLPLGKDGPVNRFYTVFYPQREDSVTI